MGTGTIIYRPTVLFLFKVCVPLFLQMLVCLLCDPNIQFSQLFVYFHHLSLIHEPLSGFTVQCQIDGICMYSCNKVSTLKNHVYRHHRNLIGLTSSSIEDASSSLGDIEDASTLGDNENVCSIEKQDTQERSTLTSTFETFHNSTFTYALKFQEVYQLPVQTRISTFSY